MKKLIPLFVAGLFWLGGTNVFANSTIESVESTDISIEFNSHPMYLDSNVIKVQMSDSENTYMFVPIGEMLERALLGFQWNDETNSLEITHTALNAFQIGRELNPILELIDVNRINLDEWLSFSGLSFALNRADIMMNGMGGDGFTVSLWVPNHNVRPPDMDIDYWFENYYEQPAPLFSSLTGCNAEKIRSVEIFVEESEFRGAHYELMFNIQDILSSGVFSAEEIESISDAIERYRNTGSDLTEEENMQERFKWLLREIASEFVFTNMSDAHLEELLEVAKLQMQDI